VSRSKSELRDASGLSYPELRKRLTPRFWRVWLELGLANLLLLALPLGLVFAQRLLPLEAALALGVVGAWAIGYVLAFIMLFFHEAAHYNVAPSRGLNDLLTNLAIGGWVGQDIRTYRPIHWAHHRELGTTRDTERTYFKPLNWSFVLESMLGVKVAQVLFGRREALGGSQAVERPADAHPLRQLLFGLALNATICGALTWLGAWVALGAWVLGVLSIYPLFGALRQLLEHRAADASLEVDYAQVDHGEVNRMFGVGPLASTFGGAGFNRHFLHHWDPQLSYTRLAELERFLLETGFAEEIETRRTSYLRAARELRRGGRG